MRRDFDVCIIGTGAGGGVMLDELTRAGFDVVALQRGPNLPVSSFTDDELEVIVRDELFAPDLLESYRLDASERAVTGRFNTVAHAVGGTMTRWSGWSWRYREDDFRVLSTEGALAGATLADWPISYAELEPFYARAEREFGVSGLAGANPFTPPRSGPYPSAPHPPRLSSLVFERGAKRAGLHPFPVPIAINPQPYNGRAGCTWGGACQGFGCMIHAKATSLSVCIPRALATGKLDLRAPARVFELPVGEDGRVRGARYLDAQGQEQEVRARHVVVSAGAMGSPHLLLMSRSGKFPNGLANSSGLVGRNLTFHHHAAARLVMDEPALGVTGIEVYRAIDDWHASDPRRGFIRGGVVAEINSFTRLPIGYALTGAGDPSLTRSWGAPLKRYLREFPRAITIGSILEDLPMAENRVDLDPDVKDAQGLPIARITHRQHPNDIAMNAWFARQIEGLAQACKPAKSWRVMLPGLTQIDAKTAMRGSAHVHGTCRMGSDAARSVLNPYCRTHDVPNLWVVDGSCFPTAGGYNPTLTLLANAYRIADHFTREAKRQNL